MPIDPAPPSPRRRWPWVLALAAAAVGTLLGLRAAGLLVLPPRHDPFAPLDVAEAPNWLTPLKLRRTRDDPAACLSALEGAGLRFEPVPDRPLQRGCGLDNAVRLRAGREVALGTPTLLSCRAALSFAMWERHELQPLARQHFGRPAVSVQHLGSYACRDINSGDGRATGRRSRHATADALDVAGVTLEGGRTLVVRRDAARPWSDGRGAADPAQAFLFDLQAGACRSFDGVLGPGYNAVHADHFHLEVGGWPVCR
ncbi:extensin family protein [Xenophilus aerolatus]|nr:extensin family protein [Xenophilus aerolatus]